MLNLRKKEFNFPFSFLVYIMNFKNFLIFISVFILVFGVSAVFGENVTLDDTVFEVPQNYTVKNVSDVSARLVRADNSDYSIFIFVSDSDSNIAQTSNAVSGFTFLDGRNYTSSNDIYVIQQNYMKNESYLSYYSFNVSDSYFLIGYSFPVHDSFVEDEENPVNTIIESID